MKRRMYGHFLNRSVPEPDTARYFPGTNVSMGLLEYNPEQLTSEEKLKRIVKQVDGIVTVHATAYGTDNLQVNVIAYTSIDSVKVEQWGKTFEEAIDKLYDVVFVNANQQYEQEKYHKYRF